MCATVRRAIAVFTASSTDVADMRGSHDPLIVGGDVAEDFHEVDILLVVGADEIVEGMAGDGEDGLAVALGVIQSVKQMQTARSGCRQTDAETPGKLGIAAGREGGGLFVPHLDQLDMVLPPAQGLKNAVDPVTGKTEDRVDFPFNQPVHQ